MLKRVLVKHVLGATEAMDTVLVEGWVRSRRDAKDFSFLDFTDGSCLTGLQVIVPGELPDYSSWINQCGTGASVRIQGSLIPSQGQGQRWELQAASVEVIGKADATYPLQKKRHSPEFMREIAHLRPRSNLFGSVFRVRSRLAQAVHRFFTERDFYYIHTPIITCLLYTSPSPRD